MRASTIMLLAVVLFVVHRWATNQKAADAKTVVEAVFAVLVIAMLDQGRTEPIARGFAWLFFIGAAYTAIPSITKAANAPANSAQGRISTITSGLNPSGGITTA